MVYPSPCFLLGATIDKTLFYVVLNLLEGFEIPGLYRLYVTKSDLSIDFGLLHEFIVFRFSLNVNRFFVFQYNLLSPPLQNIPHDGYE